MIVALQDFNGSYRIRIDDTLYEPLAFRSFRPEKDNIRSFYQAGVRLMSILHTGLDCTLAVPYSRFGEIWTGPGIYDAGAFDTQMQLFYDNAPDAFFNCMLQLDTRGWYLKAHPECSNTFLNLVETAGYQTWREDTANYLQDMLRYAEREHGDRIFAYSLFCGGSTEWYTNSQAYGNPEGEIRYHPLKEQAFRAWTGDANAHLPDMPALRHTSHGVFRHPVVDAEAIRYWRFHNSIIADTILYFVGKAREVLGRNKLLGLFYGYLNQLTSTRMLYEGHLGYERVWACPDLDMILSPAKYGAPRNFGGTSGYLHSVDSLRTHHKLCFQEIDHTTHTAPTHVENGRAIPGAAGKLKDAWQGRMVLRREYALTAAKRTGLWWFDFFGGYYTDDALKAEVANLVRVGKRLAGIEMAPISQVAVFGDVESNYYVSEFARLNDDLLVNIPDALQRMGAPYDIYTLSDLDAIDLDPYRVVIFLNAFKLDETQRQEIKARVCRDGRAVVWFYAPGYIQDDGFSVEAMGALTDIHLHEKPTGDTDVILLADGIFGKIKSTSRFGFSKQVKTDDPALLPDAERKAGVNAAVSPLFYFDDPGAIPCALYADDGLPAMGYKTLPDYTSWYCAVGNIPAAVLRELVRSAGVHIYNERDDALYVNKRLIGIHAVAEGDVTLHVPGSAHLEELFDGGLFDVKHDNVTISLKYGETKLFLRM